jgi:hypothetical protein
MLEVSIEFDLPSARLAESVAFALNQNKKINRGEVVIKSEGKTLAMQFAAEDFL